MLIKNFAKLEKDLWYLVHFKKSGSKSGTDVYLIQFSELGNGIDLISCNYGINIESPHLSKVSFDSEDFEMAYVATEKDILKYYPEAFVPLRMYLELMKEIEDLRDSLSSEIEELKRAVYKCFYK